MSAFLSLTREYRTVEAREIVDGKLYDTGKAEQVCFNLYRTSNGNYFICENCENVSFIEFSERENGNINVTEKRLSGIKPLTEQEFKDILGKTDVDKYIELFGEVEEA